MKNWHKKIRIIFTSIMASCVMMLTACSDQLTNPGNLLIGKITTKRLLPRPVPMFLGTYKEDAPDIYKTGWEHGCESGLSAYGNTYYKKFYSFQHDPELMKDPTYFRVWSDAFNYCRSYANRYLADGMWFGERDAEMGNYGIFSGNPDLRDPPNLKFGAEMLPTPFSEISSPGWGNQAWGANSSDGTDWLGSPNKDLLGGSADSHGWMGYNF